MLHLLTEENLKAYVGKPLSGVPEYIRNVSRILLAGQGFTMEAKPNRLNIVVDDAGKVTQAFYG